MYYSELKDQHGHCNTFEEETHFQQSMNNRKYILLKVNRCFAQLEITIAIDVLPLSLLHLMLVVHLRPSVWRGGGQRRASRNRLK